MAEDLSDEQLQNMLGVIAERPRDPRLAVVYRAAGRALYARGVALERTPTQRDHDVTDRRAVDPGPDPRHDDHPDQHPT